MHTSYLVGTSLQECSRYMSGNPDVFKLPEANVLAVLNGGVYFLAEVQPPERNVKVVVLNEDKIDTMQVDVVQVFNMIQQQCVAWCEI